MSSDHEGYVRRIQEEAHRYSLQLLAENERLRARLAASETEAQLAREQNLALQEEVRRQEHARAELQQRLAAAEDESRRFAQEYMEVEQQSSNLANLYVASYQLHGTLDREDALRTIQEIVANLVGSEEMALFEIGQDGDLALVASNGIDPLPLENVAVGDGIIGRVARDGRTHLTERDGLVGARREEQQLTACVPLRLAGRPTGVLAIFRLLPQKAALGPLDRELFDLLADQAAVALYCTELHRRFTATQVH